MTATPGSLPPARPSAAQTSAPAPLIPVRRPRPNILVIDDTADIRFLLKGLLQESYEVATAESGEEGLELAFSEHTPQIILLDVMMPGMDGYEVLSRLTADPKTADIPVIFLTALGSGEEERKGLELGATDYVAKPISPPILLARLRLHLERSANALRLKQLSESLSRYLAPQVYQSLFDGSRNAEIQTQRKKLTVFFSDIKNFTASTAQWQPEEVTLLLNSYFAEMSQIAADFGATLDKFIGDAIVIFFGDPYTLGVREDAVQCVRMAIAMQKRMDELQVRWRAMGINKTFEVRMGINSGFCDVGNFGSKLRMEYTIIGREVNLAARLEQAAEPREVLISAETYALVQGQIQADAREPVMAKGFAEPISVYAVHLSSGNSRAGAGVIHCERPGMRLEIDVTRLTAEQRTAAAVDLRNALERLEAPLSDAGVGEAPASPLPAISEVEVAVPKAPTPSAAPQEAAAAPAAAKVVDDKLPETIPGLDVPLGLTRAMNMKPLYMSMLRRYLDGRKDTPARIREALDQGDTKAAEILTHSLRGVSAQIGALRVPADAQALELALSEGQSREVIDALIPPLEISLGELIDGLASALPPAP